MSTENAGNKARSKSAYWITAVAAVFVLIPSMYGFVGKFIEFVHIFQGESGGEFAVAPIVNYLLASCGFFSLLLWATYQGMFSDIEAPKETLLENEAWLDRA